MGTWRDDLNGASGLLAQLLACSPDHIYIYDRECRYLFASESGPRALGLRPADFAGKHWSELGFPPHVMEPFEQLVKQVFETAMSASAETMFPLPGGNGWYEYIVHPIVDANEGTVTAAMAIARDVTRRVLAEHTAKALSRLLPICMHCKKVREDEGYWRGVEEYMHEHNEVEFSHSICPGCLEKYYPEEAIVAEA